MKEFMFILMLLAPPLLSQDQAWWEPENPSPGDSVSIFYNVRQGTLPESSSWIKLHWGINGWDEPPEVLWPPGTTPWGDGHAVESPMMQDNDTIWSISLETNQSVEIIDFVFHNNLDQWDNNSGQDWHIYLGEIPSTIPVSFILDTRSCNFSYTGSSISQVNLAGSFNGWSTTAMPMIQMVNPYIWLRWVDLVEGTHEYKFVINNSVWTTDPDNPHYTGEFQNAVIIVEKDPNPKIYIDSPLCGSVFYDIDTLNIHAWVTEGDDEIPLDESTIVVKLDSFPITHTFDPDCLTITANVNEISYGLHLASISLSDTAGNFREETSSFGIYPEGSGYYSVDAICDENYLYPVYIPEGSSDIMDINIKKNIDSLAFTVRVRYLSEYTKLGIQISTTDVAPVVEVPPPLEMKTREWNGNGIFFTIMDTSSPFFNPDLDNRVYIQRYPPVLDDSINVLISGDSLVFQIGISLLEEILGSYNVPWYFYLFSFIPDLEADSSIGGSDHYIDPDIYDVMFFENRELQEKLLANYIPDGELGGPRMASLDAVGRGIEGIEAYDIDSSLFNPGPVVRLLTRSGIVYDSIYTIDGTISDNSIAEAILTINGMDTTISVTSGFFSASILLDEGDNIISCRAQNSEGFFGFSPSINLELIVDHKPKAIIDTVFFVGESIFVAGTSSYDPDGDGLTYLWYPDSLNPEEIFFSEPESVITSFSIPSTNGEYYFNLSVEDPDSNHDFARAFITVSDSGVSIAGTDSISEWLRNAIIYEIFVQSFSDNGDFDAISERITEIKDLGVNCIWFMPINKSTYTNGYSVTDYYGIRTDYGTEEDLREFLSLCRDNGIKVIIDHVVNHCSNQHPWMIDAQCFGEYSHFYHNFMWGPGGNYYYTAGADLPDLNYGNEHLKKYLLDMAVYWLSEFDLYGFRCDMAWAVENRDPEYWITWREILKSKKPEAFLLAEATSTNFIYFDSRFDAAYDWNLHHESPASFANIFDGGVTGSEINTLHNAIRNFGYPFPEDRFPLRFLENHDETRYIAYNTLEQTKLMAALLLTIPGMPLIYSGQEVGEVTLRDKIDWSDPNNLRPYYKKLCWIRNNFSSIRNSELTRLSTSSQTVYSFYRKNNENIVICGFNFYSGGNYTIFNIPTAELGIHPDSTYYMNDVLNNEYIQVSGSGLSNFGTNLPGYGAKIFVLSDSILIGIEEPAFYVNKLNQNHPNPFKGTTDIRFQIPDFSKVSLKIYDVSGRLVRTLIDGKLDAGYHRSRWDGKDEEGRNVGAGIYFCKFANNQFSDTRKMILVK
ncbi:T9SS type A sorting domain-containing protein [candidate division WOR-3 bacterium]|nr:T9SS type A sorting domain-containing protein [candidate division WOR-3 bacterium]